MTAAKCALCRKGHASTQGEHVLPKWFLKRFPASAGPYQVEIDGVAAVKRDGATPRAMNNFGAFKLPCCVACNSALSHRFEREPTQDIINRLYDGGGAVVADAAESRRLALWLVKTWLLLAHPRSWSSDPALSIPGWEAPPGLFAWMVSGEDPPPDLSMWIYRQGSHRQSNPRGMSLPVLISGTRRHPVQQNGLSIQTVGTSLVHHPGRRIEQPLEAAGLAVRVWPLRVGATLDTTNLPPVGLHPVNWSVGPDLTLRHGCTLAQSRTSLPALGDEGLGNVWSDLLLHVASARLIGEA